MECMLRLLAGLLDLVGLGPARRPAEPRSTMPEVTSQFELRQLLKAYRRGLISDELFEEQLQEIHGAVHGNGNGAAPQTATKVYRVRDRTFPTEREMVLHFLDEFRAGEAFGGEVFALWYAVSPDPRVRGGLQVVREREAMHGKLLGARMVALGGKCQASLPEKFQTSARARLGSPTVSDADKLADFVRRLPDVDAAVAPIRDVVAQIDEDCESRALLESILEDEMATVRWFHATVAALG